MESRTALVVMMKMRLSASDLSFLPAAVSTVRLTCVGGGSISERESVCRAIGWKHFKNLGIDKPPCSDALTADFYRVNLFKSNIKCNLTHNI